jgi:hypothetical protein
MCGTADISYAVAQLAAQRQSPTAHLHRTAQLFSEFCASPAIITATLLVALNTVTLHINPLLKLYKR